MARSRSRGRRERGSQPRRKCSRRRRHEHSRRRQSSNSSARRNSDRSEGKDNASRRDSAASPTEVPKAAAPKPSAFEEVFRKHCPQGVNGTEILRVTGILEEKGFNQEWQLQHATQLVLQKVCADPLSAESDHRAFLLASRVV